MTSPLIAPRSEVGRLLRLGAALAMSGAALFIAALMVESLRPSASVFARTWELLPYVVAARVICSHAARLDRIYWAHVGLRDLLRLSAAAMSGTLGAMALLLIVPSAVPGDALPVLVLECLFFLVGMSALWSGCRWHHERTHPRKNDADVRAFIIGAGSAGEQILRQMQHDTRHKVRVVGLVDDDPSKRDRSLHGVPVVGAVDDLRRLAALHDVSLAFVAIPSASTEQLRRLVAHCREAGVRTKLLPPLRKLIDGEVTPTDLRDVRIEDLLGREPIALDLTPARSQLADRVICVTGAAGSIGSELARQIASCGARRLILIDRAESPLHALHLALRAEFPHLELVPVLASVTNADRIARVFDWHRPDAVFHAAAYKQLPVLETNVVEGLWNNVIGTLRVARAAAASGTRRFVLISTDKAVNPSSVLGVTKLLAERVVLELPSLRTSDTEFRAVRFGNVLGSEGSVVPLFTAQIAAGGPVTVTHPEVRRYFMSIPEAAQLVLQSASLPEAAGRIALLEMGEQIRIADLAEQMIHLAGRVPHEEVRIVFTGLRPGEKLEEQLVGAGETTAPTSIAKVRLIERAAPLREDLARQLRQLTTLAARGDESALVRALAQIAPEYHPDPSLATRVIAREGLALVRSPRGERAVARRLASGGPIKGGASSARRHEGGSRA